MAPIVVTTVTAPASSYDLVDLATVKDDLMITDTSSDAFLQRVITRVSNEAKLFCNRVFQVEALTDQIFPARDTVNLSVLYGERMQPLQVTRWPMLVGPTVTEDETNGDTVLVEGTDYLVKYEVGQLIRLDVHGRPKQWRSLPVTVAYQAGYATIPPDVQDAAIRLVNIGWYSRTRDRMLRQENVPNVLEQSWWFASGPGSATGDMPPDVAAILERYRVPVIG